MTRAKRLGRYLQIWARAHPGEPLLCAIGGGEAEHGDHIIARANGGTDDPANLRPLCGLHNAKRQNELFTDEELRQWPCRRMRVSREEELRPIAEPLGFTLEAFPLPGLADTAAPEMWQIRERKLMLYIDQRFTSTWSAKRWLAKHLLQSAREYAVADGWRVLRVHASGITRFRDHVTEAIVAFVRDPSANDFTFVEPRRICELDDAWESRQRSNVGIVGHAILRSHSDHLLWYQDAGRLPEGPHMKLREQFEVWERPRGRKCRNGERRRFLVVYSNGAERAHDARTTPAPNQ